MSHWKSISTIALAILLTYGLAWLGENPELLSPRGALIENDAPPLPTLPPATPTPSPTPSIPMYGEDELWMLAIASTRYPLSEQYEIETTTVEGYLFDERAAGALQDMLDAARADGMDIRITSSWRSRATQAELYENRVYRFQLEGYSREEAEALGATVVLPPGTSEHELGLSVDFVTGDYSALDSGFAEQPEYAWLIEHCAEFGFIQRYPSDKGELTGIIWEPWHYRYVGVEVAEYIMANGLCLEEYLEEAGLLPQEGE